jgi:hypothetical protein
VARDLLGIASSAWVSGCLGVSLSPGRFSHGHQNDLPHPLLFSRLAIPRYPTLAALPISFLLQARPGKPQHGAGPGGRWRVPCPIVRARHHHPSLCACAYPFSSCTSPSTPPPATFGRCAGPLPRTRRHSHPLHFLLTTAAGSGRRHHHRADPAVTTSPWTIHVSGPLRPDVLHKLRERAAVWMPRSDLPLLLLSTPLSNLQQ